MLSHLKSLLGSCIFCIFTFSSKSLSKLGSKYESSIWFNSGKKIWQTLPNLYNYWVRRTISFMMLLLCIIILKYELTIQSSWPFCISFIGENLSSKTASLESSSLASGRLNFLLDWPTLLTSSSTGASSGFEIFRTFGCL